MQNLIKLAVWMAPVLFLILLIIMGRLDKNAAQMEVETATFDRQFAHEEIVLADTDEDKKFWQKELAEAAKREKEAAKKLAKAEGKVIKDTEMIEKTLKKMDKEQNK